LTSLVIARRMWTLPQQNKYTRCWAKHSMGRRELLKDQKIASNRASTGGFYTSTGKSGSTPALLSLFTNHSSALIICRAPLANILDVAKTAQTDFVFIQPAGADARRRHCRTDVAVERFCGFSRCGHNQISSNSSSAPACSSVRRATISLSSSSVLSHFQALRFSS